MLSHEPLSAAIVAEFEHLLAPFGLKVVQALRYQGFGNWSILLTADRFRVRVFQDRGEVYMSIGLPWPELDANSGPWYTFEELVRYLDLSAPGLPPAGDAANEARINWYIRIMQDSLDTLLARIKEIESEPDEFSRFRKQQFDQLFRRRDA